MDFTDASIGMRLMVHLPLSDNNRNRTLSNRRFVRYITPTVRSLY